MAGKLVLCLAAILLFLPVVDGMCSMAKVTNSATGLCLYEYKDVLDNTTKLKLMKHGEKLKDMGKCMAVSCSNSYLSFCGIGINAGVFSIPGCKAISGPNCTIVMVDAQNETEECRPPVITTESDTTTTTNNGNTNENNGNTTENNGNSNENTNENNGNTNENNGNTTENNGNTTENNGNSNENTNENNGNANENNESPANN